LINLTAQVVIVMDTPKRVLHWQNVVANNASDKFYSSRLTGEKFLWRESEGENIKGKSSIRLPEPSSSSSSGTFPFDGDEQKGNGATTLDPTTTFPNDIFPINGALYGQFFLCL